jgi:hypothetical protein
VPTERLSMRKTREILRLKWQQGRSHREIAHALAIGSGTPSDVAKRALAAGIASWEAVAALDDDELERKLYQEPLAATAQQRPKPDPAQIHIELRRPGVTLRLSSCAGRASRCGCCTRSICRRIPAGTATRGTSRSTTTGRPGCGS